MPRKASNKPKHKTIFDDLRLGESYTSLVLGIIVVIIGSIILLSLPRVRNADLPQTSSTQITKNIAQITDSENERVISSVTKGSENKINNEKSNEKLEEEKLKTNDKKEEIKNENSEIAQGSNYTVQKGDNLWDISVRAYNSGFNWVEIARTNKLSNSDLIEEGTKLKIPKIEQNMASDFAKGNKLNVQENKNDKNEKITGSQYTVVKGDNLWDISVRAYADGYKWTEIAKVNKIENPDLILIDQKIKLPRK